MRCFGSPEGGTEGGREALRTPVCSSRYEIAWDHFDASMSSYTSLSPSALKTSLTPNCTFVHALSCLRTSVCTRARARVSGAEAAKCDITRIRLSPEYMCVCVCVWALGAYEIADCT